MQIEPVAQTTSLISGINTREGLKKTNMQRTISVTVNTTHLTTFIAFP
jgi:hypothetical protein